MKVAKEQTLMIPATLEGYEYAEEIMDFLNKNKIPRKRKDATTGISITWTIYFEVKKGDTHEI